MKNALSFIAICSIAVFISACADGEINNSFGVNGEDPELGKSLFEPAREADAAARGAARSGPN